MARGDDKNKEKHDNLQEKVLQDIYKMFDIIEFIEKYPANHKPIYTLPGTLTE
jgi:aspartyl/asparaginyl-tRNA synthetase